ncbi:MAG: response regulator [Sedimentisphaerales bacterium]|nr:response regulator [Sedimentisphaerales bacterium]
MAEENSGVSPQYNQPEQASKAKVLVLRGGHKTPMDNMLESVCHCFEVTCTDNVEEALYLLKQHKFDAVFTETADFLPLERASVTDQALAILNTIGEGVCIVDRYGTVLWANFRMEGFSEPIRQGITERGRRAFEFFESQISQGNLSKSKLRPRKYSFTDEQSNRYFEMIANPMLTEGGDLAQVALVVWDETTSRRFQQRINAIDKAGRELVRLEAETITVMNVEQRINLLQNKIIRYAKELLKFDHFVIRLLNRNNNQLECLFGVGLPYDDHLEIFASAENNGVTGYVAATGRSYICNDPAGDPRYLAGLDGACCSLTVPLLLHDKVIGTLNVESHKKQAFTEDDRQVAEIFGRYIAIAMNILDLLVVERYQTTGQTADNLNRQVAYPLNDIMTEVSLLMEDYIGHDDLRHRLQGIIDRVVNIKTQLKDVKSQPKGIFGASTAENVAVDPQLLTKQILVVDDEEFIRQTIADVVQKYGCIVDIARDGREAKALLAQRQYDLVISDIKMPYADGYEIFATAREADRNIPVILMTGFGYDPNHTIVRANREGLNAVIYKPFKVEQLINEIRNALGRGQQKK